MKKLYKYFSNLDFDYFENPSLKLTSASALNDPFETIVASEFIALSELLLDKNGQAYNMFKRIFGNDVHIEKGFNTLLNMSGVVSLSETQHNLLMWAHYANQHKGLCIGYKSDMLESVTFPAYEKVPVIKNPIKVNYDNRKLLDYENDINYTSDNTVFNSIIKKVLTTKGDDWIYEKEHRIILPLNIADRLGIYENGKFTIKKVYNGSSSRFKEKKKFEKFKYADSTNQNYSFLLDIEPSSILEVYIGCKMPLDKAKQLKLQIASGNKTKHIKVFRFKESKDRFELELDKSF